MSAITLPKRGRGRQGEAAQAQYEANLEAFCQAIFEIQSRLDFRVSSRGWCYLLEEYGLGKGEFDTAQRVINDCRKSGLLPLDICADDGARAALHLSEASAGHDDTALDDLVESALEDIETARDDAIDSVGWDYSPHDFWYDQPVYLEMLVEKVDLKELFAKTCRRFRIPLANSRGWPDLNSRAVMMRRFQKMENEGKRCVLLYCGDHDPAGLQISESLRKMLEDLSPAIGWWPDDLIIDRFGLNLDFIEANNLSWIDGLETGSGRNLNDPRHPDHEKAYVQNYLLEFGARKVEANALVTRPEEGRALCLEAITKFVSAEAPEVYSEAVRTAQQQIKNLVLERLEEVGP